MKAVVVDVPGKIEDFKEVELNKPAVEPNEVLIEVHAVSINPVDHVLREGKMPMKEDSPVILGTDLSGVVAEVGEDVSEFKKGDQVFTSYKLNRGGGLAEYVSIPEKYVVRKPANASFEEAAGLGIAALTAYQLVNKEGFKVQKDERIFVQGGSGGVGTFVVQFAKHNGGNVTATTSRNEELLESLNVDHVVNYNETDVSKAFSNRFDFLIDTADQGTETLPVLVEGGRALTSVTPFDEEKANERKIKAERIGYQIVPQQLQLFINQVANNDLQVVIDEVFPFTEEGVQEAFKLSETGHAVGKIIIQVKEG